MSPLSSISPILPAGRLPPIGYQQQFQDRADDAEAQKALRELKQQNAGVRWAAMALQDPSARDQQVATQATRMEMEAQRELAQSETNSTEQLMSEDEYGRHLDSCAFCSGSIYSRQPTTDVGCGRLTRNIWRFAACAAWGIKERRTG